MKASLLYRVPFAAAWLVFSLAALPCLYPVAARAQADSKAAQSYCDAFADILVKPIPVKELPPALYNGAFGQPRGEQTPADPAPASTSTNAPPAAEPAKEPKLEQRFDLVTGDDVEKDTDRDDLVTSLVTSLGKDITYDQPISVQLLHKDDSLGKRYITMYAVHLTGNSLAEIQANPPRVIPPTGSKYRLEHRIVKNVLLVLVTANVSIFLPTPSTPSSKTADVDIGSLKIPKQEEAPSRYTPRSRGNEKSNAELDKKLADLEKSGQPSSPPKAPASNTYTPRRPYGYGTTPEEIARRKTIMTIGRDIATARGIFREL